MTFEFTVTQTHDVNLHHLMRDYPHIITPTDVGLDDHVQRCEVLQFESDAPVIHGVAILRQFLQPENDGTQGVLTQHLSNIVSAKMGVTAKLLPFAPALHTVEQEIAANARRRVIKHHIAERRRKNWKR